MTAPHLTRRRLLGSSLGAAVLAACGGRTGRTGRTDAALAPTPQVPDDDAAATRFDAHPATCAATADNIEGPFFKAGAPERAVLADRGVPGDRLELAGVVRGVDCAPLAGARLQIWQADARGGYDLDGWGLRGQLRTDGAGRWQVSTIVPGRYLNGRRYRPRHVHVKLHAPGHVALTTQLYFPGDPYNQDDPFFLGALLMRGQRRGDTLHAGLDLVLAAA